MRAQVSMLALVGLAAYGQVWAQQLPFYMYPYDSHHGDLSAECIGALDTPVECSDLLGRHAGDLSVPRSMAESAKVLVLCQGSHEY